MVSLAALNWVIFLFRQRPGHSRLRWCQSSSVTRAHDMRLISTNVLLPFRRRVQTCKDGAFLFSFLRKFGFGISTGQIEVNLGTVGSKLACAFEFFDRLPYFAHLDHDPSEH